MKIDEDKQAVIYAYSGGDINDENRDREADKAFDGVLWIDKSILGWPRDKTKKQQQRVPWTSEAIKEGIAYVFQPCENAFAHHGCEDYIAYRLLDHIFQRIYHGEEFPEKESFIQ